MGNPSTLLGFDFGTKRIGVAVGQTETRSASALESVTSKQNVPNWLALSKVIDEWQPQALVVGIPVNMDGSKQNLTARARHFAKSLHMQTQLPVYETDERLTTISAKQLLFEQHGDSPENHDLDSTAASIILESFLQTYQPGNPATYG